MCETGHSREKCPDLKTKKCYYCGTVGDHHRSICQQKYGRIQQTNPPPSVNQVTVPPATGTGNISQAQDGASNVSQQGQAPMVSVPLSMLQNLLANPSMTPNQTTPSTHNGLTNDVTIKEWKEVIMPIAKVTLFRDCHPKINMEVRALCDTGSSKTYVSEKLVDKLGLIQRNGSMVTVSTFGDQKRPYSFLSYETDINVKLNDGTHQTWTVNTAPRIVDTIEKKPISLTPQDRIKLADLDLADDFVQQYTNVNIDLQIGSDRYASLLTGPSKIELSSGIFLCNSLLGWIASGEIRDPMPRKEPPTMTNLLQHYVNAITISTEPAANEEKIAQIPDNPDSYEETEEDLLETLSELKNMHKEIDMSREIEEIERDLKALRKSQTDPAQSEEYFEILEESNSSSHNSLQFPSIRGAHPSEQEKPTVEAETLQTHTQTSKLVTSHRKTSRKKKKKGKKKARKTSNYF